MLFPDLFSHWFSYSIIGTLCFGVSMALYKWPAHDKEIDTNALNTWRNIVGLLLALLFFYGSFTLLLGDTILIALLRGGLYTTLTLLQMYALTKVETNTLYPVTSTLSLLIVIVTGISFFHDAISTLQLLGMLLAIVAIYGFSYRGGKWNWGKNELYLGLALIVLSAVSNIVHKFAADMGDIYNFQIWFYLFIFATGLVPLFVQHKKETLRKMWNRKSFMAGATIAAFGFLGGYALLVALTKGPLSLAQTINSAYLFITVPLAAFLFNEKLTRRKIALILLAFAAIIIIRLG